MGTSNYNGFIFCDGKLISPLLKLQDARSAVLGCKLRDKVAALGVHYADLLDYLNDRYRDWPGSFYDQSLPLREGNIDPIDEIFVDMGPLYDAPVEWWRDTFAPRALQRPIVRIRCEALPRWRAIGSLFYAWYPDQRPAWLGTPANDNFPLAGK